MHGLLSAQQIVGFLNALDVYVHCTHGENMSTAIMQAMSCGLPVIASDVEGVSNMLANGVGILYEPASFDDLAEKLGLLASDKPLRVKMGEGSRAYALTNFNIYSSVDQYTSILSKFS
jgi:glycosyltransferase involved in cell wall biosynthesis